MSAFALEFVRSCPGPAHLPTDGLPEIALAGRSNVGKSSLLNKLAGRRSLARTSSSPGCTRLLNLYSVPGRFHVIDLPGYGYAKAPVGEVRRWTDWIGEYLVERAPLRGVVLLVDARHPELDSDAEMAGFLLERGRPFIVALTKSDKLSRSRLAGARRKAEAMGPVVPVSSVTGAGLPELRRWMARAVAV